MPLPISKETREKIIYHNKNGAKNIEISRWLCVSERSVERILKLYRETKTVSPAPHNKGRKPAFCDAKLKKIIARIREQPDITLEELIEHFHVNISVSALSRKLTRLDLTFKKRRYSAENNSALMSNGFVANGSNI